MLSYKNCMLCPRRCGVDRTAGERGFCKMGAELTAAKAMLHYGEEPPICGSFGTGAVFFSGCTLRCKFCQNSEISLHQHGQAISSDELRAVFERLIDDGAQSIDLVTPTQFLPSILPALTPKLPVPVIYNCGGYERVETLRELEGLIDIYLPDYKYSDPALAARLSGAPDYVETAQAAILEMFRQVGTVQLEDDEMKRGVLIRHLVLPGYIENSLGAVEWIAETFPKNSILFSLLRQYTPIGGQEPPLDRRVSDEEYDGVLSWMELCGLDNGFIQDAAAATTEYLPEFDGSGLDVSPEKRESEKKSCFT